MAIDGTKIIDSDLAHDIYGEFMDLYDSDVDIAAIKNKIEVWRKEDLDFVEFEIFITAYALALWETGNLNDDLLSEVRQIINKEAGIKMWLEESGESDSKKRRNVLEKFLRKISTPKINPRKRKKFKKVTDFLFAIDDLIVFQIQDSSYRAVILSDIFQYRGKCIYQFTATSYMKEEKPTEFAIKNCSIFINKIGCNTDREILKKNQPGIEKLWNLDNKFSIPFIIGLVLDGIEHQDLTKFVERFEVIGKVKINPSFKEIGSIGYENTFEGLAKRYENLVDRQTKVFKYEMVKLRDLIQP